MDSRIFSESRVHICDPLKSRIFGNGEDHKIEAKAEGNIMAISATGKYLSHLRGMVERYGLQYARLNLSKEDADRLVRSGKNGRLSKYLAHRLEKLLEPEEMLSLSFSPFGVIYGTEQLIRFTLPISVLRTCEEVIGKSLIGSDKESRVIQLVKEYGLLSRLNREKLSDLKSIAREIPEIDLRIIYGHPMVTHTDAKKMLDEEIELIVKSSNRFNANQYLVSY